MKITGDCIKQFVPQPTTTLVYIYTTHIDQRVEACAERLLAHAKRERINLIITFSRDETLRCIENTDITLDHITIINNKHKLLIEQQDLIMLMIGRAKSFTCLPLDQTPEHFGSKEPSFPSYYETST